MTRAGSNGSDPSDDHLQINLPPPTFEFGFVPHGKAVCAWSCPLERTWASRFPYRRLGCEVGLVCFLQYAEKNSDKGCWKEAARTLARTVLIYSGKLPLLYRGFAFVSQSVNDGGPSDGASQAPRPVRLPQPSLARSKALPAPWRSRTPHLGESERTAGSLRRPLRRSAGGQVGSGRAAGRRRGRAAPGG